MTYSESARGVKITEARALAELRAHHICDPEDVAYALAAAHRRDGWYDAHKLLLAIGY